jgi:transposase-like protein
MMYVRYPLTLRNVEDLLGERGIDISHETVRWNRFGPIFAARNPQEAYPTCAAILSGAGIWMRSL